MLSPVSGRFGSNLAQSIAQRVQAPLGEMKVSGVKPQGPQQGEAIKSALSQLEQMIAQLQGMLSRTGAVPPGSNLGASGASPAAAPAKAGGYGGYGGAKDSFSPAGGMAAPSGLPSLNGSGAASLAGIQVSDPQVAQALQQIASHPDGARLIEAAKANGLTSISHNPSLNPDGGAGTEGLAIWGNGSVRIELANPNSPGLIQTLAHELGHAATTRDGNSQLEEKVVDTLGERIFRDLTGRASGFNLDESAYTHLPSDNGILNSMRMLGIRV